jgi:hypothetical protein
VRWGINMPPTRASPSTSHCHYHLAFSLQNLYLNQEAYYYYHYSPIMESSEVTTASLVGKFFHFLSHATTTGFPYRNTNPTSRNSNYIQKQPIMAPRRRPNLRDIIPPPTASNTLFNTPSTPSPASSSSTPASDLSLPDTPGTPKSPHEEKSQILTTDCYLDREQKYCGEMLTRFRNIVNLAGTRKEEDDGSMATREGAASAGLRREVESWAFVSIYVTG